MLLAKICIGEKKINNKGRFRSVFIFGEEEGERRKEGEGQEVCLV